MGPIKIFLIDNNKNFLSTAIRFIETEPSFEVVGYALSGEEGIEKIKISKPDLVLMDLSMPGIGGFKATKLLKLLKDSPRIVILTLHDTPEYRSEAVFCGADGFISKSEFGTDLIPLIKSLFSALMIVI